MPADLRGLKGAFVLVGVADGTLLPFVPLYLYQRGVTAAGIGAVLAAQAVVWLFAGLACGYLADHRLAAEHILLAGTSAAAVLALTLALAVNGTVLGLLIVALTLVRSPLTLLDAIALRRLLHASRTGYARIRLRQSAGWAVSAVASGAVYHVFGLGLIPFVYGPLTALFAIWVWRRLRPELGRPVVAAGAAPAGVRLAGIPAAMLTFLLSCLLLGVALAATQNFVTLQIDVLGGGALLVGAAAAFQALTEVPTMGFSHVLTARLGHYAMFAIGCAIYLVVFVAWAVMSSALAVALLKLVIGVGFALTYVASVLIANELSPSRLRATGQALVKSVLFGVAPIVGALGGGVVYGSFGPRVMFLASTLVIGAAGVVAMLSAAGGRAAARAMTAVEPAAQGLPALQPDAPGVSSS